MQDIANFLDSLNARVSISRSKWDNRTPWTCSIEIEVDGSTFQTTRGGKTMEEALLDCHAQFRHLAPKAMLVHEHHNDED